MVEKKQIPTSTPVVSSHILILFLLSSEAFKISKEQKKFYRNDVHNYTDISYN